MLQGEDVRSGRPIPVILDTDIGDDIDDTWALGFLLQCPEVEVRLIVGDQGRNLYRARLIAKFLERAGRTDVPIGIGLDLSHSGDGPQAEWVKDYNINHYPGKIYPDGVRAIASTIMESSRPITLISIGPTPNIARALQLEPQIAQRARFVGMHGSLRRGYGGSAQPSAEYNVRANVEAFRQVLKASWPITITPLDTCGIVILDGELYQAVRQSRHPVANAVMENYEIWCRNSRPSDQIYLTRSTTLFDTVAVWLAISEQWLKMEEVPICVTDDGMTQIVPEGRLVKAATEWLDLQAFRRELVKRLVNEEADVRLK